MGLNDLNDVCDRECEELSGQNYDGITSLSAWFLLRKLVSIPRRDNPAITYSDTLSADYNHHFVKFQPVSILVHSLSLYKKAWSISFLVDHWIENTWLKSVKV